MAIKNLITHGLMGPVPYMVTHGLGDLEEEGGGGGSPTGQNRKFLWPYLIGFYKPPLET